MKGRAGVNLTNPFCNSPILKVRIAYGAQNLQELFALDLFVCLFVFAQVCEHTGKKVREGL